MKKILMLIEIVACSSVAVAQEKKEVTIKAGTIVPLEAVNAVRASKVHVGQSVDFRVTRDVLVDGEVAIPSGTLAKGTVYEAQCNSWWGTKGRLGIKLRNLTTANGEVLYLTGSDVNITGKNRTPLSVVTFIFVWPCCFIHGSRAEMPVGYEVDAELASTATVTL
ncbi:MAG: hypothetical protein LUC49_07780 [Prevotella sp.]|nr:hypothetical protein [Prevotella sp.]